MRGRPKKQLSRWGKLGKVAIGSAEFEIPKKIPGFSERENPSATENTMANFRTARERQRSGCRLDYVLGCVGLRHS